MTAGAIKKAGRLWLALAAIAVGGAATPFAAFARPIGLEAAPTPKHRAGHVRPAHTAAIVHLLAEATVARYPGGPAVGTVPTRTPLDSPTWLWAVSRGRHGRWLRVVLPWRPNGLTGWIRRRSVQVVHSPISITVDLSRRRLVLRRAGLPLARFAAGIGAFQTPTPIGRFSVTDRVPTGDPQGPFGWFALGLSGHQPRLPAGWSGGDQLAIHGTNEPASIGAAASAGCIHVSRRALRVLRRYVRLGTPVRIHA